MNASGSLACEFTQFNIIGTQKTDENWLRNYLQIEHIKVTNDEDLERIRQKIMTTDIYSSAQVTWDENDSKQCTAKIVIQEKFTRIPVVRGVYGGGTPLLILGGYETNAFGKLYAMGGELRRYGNMAPGAFFFFKSPRAWQGKGLWGGELWLDRRRRAFYDDEGRQFGHVDSEAWTIKAQLLYPWLNVNEGNVQIGFHSQVSRENPAKFEVEQNYKGRFTSAPKNLEINSDTFVSGAIGPMLAYDNLRVEGLNLSGIKAKSFIGQSRSNKKSGGFAEGELFAYSLLPNDLNIAGRIFAGSSSLKSTGSVYYLGGFDSIRGLPDGIHYGNKIIYGNFEARYVAARFKFAHIQPALFYDSGAAWMDDANPNATRETSIGGGVRISIPQVYRLILRIDYGVSIGHTKARGISVALNQFFQPYKLVF